MEIKTINELKIFCEGDGYLLESLEEYEINEAIQRIGTLPVLMIEFLQKIGCISISDEFDDRNMDGTGWNFYIPNELVIKTIRFFRNDEDRQNGIDADFYFQRNPDSNKEFEKVLIFSEDIYGSCEVGIKLEDLQHDNPPVYYLTDSPEPIQEGTLMDCYVDKLVNY